MPVANTSLVERIARTLAGRAVSINAEGSDASAGARGDAIWPDYRDDALAILHTLREPDAAMAAAGDADIWEEMVTTALRAEETAT